MKILVLSNEVWNDKINGNNVTSNWFEGMDAEFANIYASPDTPYNNCCDKYFQITDSMMLRSLIKGIRAGRKIDCSCKNESATITAEPEPKRLYAFLKRISGSSLRLVREVLWLFGRYDMEALEDFVKEFDPDIIFSERMASCKMLRMERVIMSVCKVPIFAFTGDDEYSLRQLSFSPSFWMNRIMVRKMLRDNVKKYKIYYTLSREQAEYYEKIFGCKCKLLYKCGELPELEKSHQVNSPIRMVYAGKFYCNRWKALRDIVDVLRKINIFEKKIILEIYTKDKPTPKQNRILNDGINSYIMGSVSQEKLKQIYSKADIAIHVESLDTKYKLATRFSFSTKIIDCLFSGCAVLAYCWCNHSGLTYLKREDAALCISSKEELRKILFEISQDKTIVQDFANKARKCAERNHLKQMVQANLLDDFKSYYD